MSATDRTVGWTKEGVLKVLLMNDSKLGKLTLDTLVRKQITVYRASRIRYWYKAREHKKWLAHELHGMVWWEQGEDGDWQRPFKQIIVIHAAETDAMAALTLVHEVTHWRKGHSEFIARKSEVEFLVEAPQIIRLKLLGRYWYRKYTTEWMTKQGGQWVITPANRAKIKAYANRLSESTDSYVYKENAFGITEYSFGRKTPYTGEDWQPGQK